LERFCKKLIWKWEYGLCVQVWHHTHTQIYLHIPKEKTKEIWQKGHRKVRKVCWTPSSPPPPNKIKLDCGLETNNIREGSEWRTSNNLSRQDEFKNSTPTLVVFDMFKSGLTNSALVRLFCCSGIGLACWVCDWHILQHSDGVPPPLMSKSEL